MPYIEPYARVNLNPSIKAVVKSLDDGGWQVGEVNYVIYKILLAWWKNEPRYKTICSIMGTLTSVTQEFYRKVAAEYEQKAENKNGEIT
jgi:hypothetical protein